jgi:DNA-binding NarL/FixJ family response regulator
MPETHATVALLEDDPSMRERLAAAIIANPQLELVYCGESSRDCMAWLADHPVQVLLVDLGLPDGSGIDVIRHCRALHPACDAMVITMFGDEANMLQAFAAGARGYLLKDGTERDLARHVLDLRAGGSPMSPIIARRLLQVWHSGNADGAAAALLRRAERMPEAALVTSTATGTPRSPAARPEALTPREAEVLALVARGFIYDEVAARMGLSIATVRTHVRSIYGKLDVHNKTEAVFEARALGWLD